MTVPTLTRRDTLVGGAAMLLTSARPNILFLMTDQMQGRVLEPGHPCHAPNLRKLADRGVRFSRAYTPNPICSPARASLMTGLLPHSHGVIQNTHVVRPDQAVLRTDKPHWAQRLTAAGYRTAYFGKWHVERSNELSRFGWQTYAVQGTEAFSKKLREVRGGRNPADKLVLSGWIRGPEGYTDSLLYGASDGRRNPTLDAATSLAREFLDGALKQRGQPWCCFVSVVEPHDPYVPEQASLRRYDIDALPAAPNWNDRMEDKPGLYRKAAQGIQLGERQKKEAAACYYASITEIDERFGELLDQVERAGELDNTIVVLGSDHGEFLGAHGLYMKNVGAFEEAYNIPLVFAGPGIARGTVTRARMGLQDVGPTLLDLAGVEPISAPDSRSFAPVLRDPAKEAGKHEVGFAEYYGSIFWYSQQVVWDGDWKFVWNGFDFDELYNLAEDPFEMRNLVMDAGQRDRIRHMMRIAYRIAGATGERYLFPHYSYPTLRLGSFGPGLAGAI